MNAFKAGVLALVVIALFAYFGFTKTNPFASPYEMSAVFDDARNLATGSPVRIAGVDVGRVTAVEPYGDGGDAAEVTMEIRDDGLPIAEDAELVVRPRIFLEGNFFVDLRPGSPSAAELEDGGTVPSTQTSTSVSLSEVTSVLQSDVRSDLRTLLFEYGRALDGGGAEAFNDAIPWLAPAYRFAAQTNTALLGTEPGRDLPRLLRGQSRTAAALAADPEALQELVTDLNVTAGAFARQEAALEASIPALRDTLAVASPTLASVNATLPTLRLFAREALPGVRSATPTLDAANPWITQARRLVREPELKGLARDLRAATPDLVRLNQRLVPFLRQARTLSSCTNRVLVPFAESTIPSVEPGNSDQEVRRQLMRSLVGLGGESRLSDANTPMFHIQGVSPIGIGQGQLEPLPPPDPRTPPAHRPDVPCETQEPPELDAPSAPASALTGGALEFRPTAALATAARERRTTRRAGGDALARLARALDRRAEEAR